ncbi:hypothetical protein F9278_15015 [Streptomyces phaeolivaceus]|uniref:Uncharacterized protein n=1 Tax=Streptomyces phaeolivaceus TaxID=2653200 RepID=A0A5P8K2U4_9ACTN|nr:hypothetical protein [Streptomyces phaeolivaceus]QFQ97300.1 hypothetical protein F9278_15015 [Streptomyces phaeolivaceus]
MNDLMEQLPRPMVERIGRMSGMALRSIIALIDEQPDTFAALVERIGTWDDDPGRTPMPLPRYQFAIREALRIVNDALTAIEERSPLPNEVLVEGACDLIKRLAPAQYREDALAKMAAFPAGSEPMDISGGEDAGPVDFVIAAAAGAWLCGGAGGRMATLENIRLMLLQQVRNAESTATGAPERERVDQVSDEDALALLADLYDEDYAHLIPGPRERGPWEWDMLAVLKTHLLETPADATSPNQAKELKTRLLTVLQAAAATQRTKPSVRTVGKRTQPKRTPKRKRKGK